MDTTTLSPTDYLATLALVSECFAPAIDYELDAEGYVCRLWHVPLHRVSAEIATYAR